MLPQLLRNYYKDNYAVFSLSIESGKEHSCVKAIYVSWIGENNAVAGEAVNIAFGDPGNVGFRSAKMQWLSCFPVIIVILLLSNHFLGGTLSAVSVDHWCSNCNQYGNQHYIGWGNFLYYQNESACIAAPRISGLCHLPAP